MNVLIIYLKCIALLIPAVSLGALMMYASLKAAGFLPCPFGWRDANKRLPRKRDMYDECELLVMIDGADVPTTLYYIDGLWVDEHGISYKVTHWQPLPDMPFVEEVKEK